MSEKYVFTILSLIVFINNQILVRNRHLCFYKDTYFKHNLTLLPTIYIYKTNAERFKYQNWLTLSTCSKIIILQNVLPNIIAVRGFPRTKVKQTNYLQKN